MVNYGDVNYTLGKHLNNICNENHQYMHFW